jgi:hypothetical protein
MMACDCDLEMPEFFYERLQRARKQHVCNECRGPIAIGANYKRLSGKWNGEFQEFKQCETCLGLIDFMNAHIKCFCFGLGTLVMDAVETVREWGDEASSLVFPVYRHYVRRKHNIKALRNPS